MTIFNETAGLQGKVAVVTGGSRGIGRAISELFAKEGVRVYFFYLTQEEKALQFVAEAEALGLSIHAKKVDVRDKAQCEGAMHAIHQQNGRIDILVNNSGIIRDNLLIGFEEDEIQAVVDTNLMGVFHVTQTVVPFMMQQRSGKIINISSVAGEKPGRGQSNYAATKGAINAITKALAVELAPRKIMVNAVAPGVIETEMSQEIRESYGEEALSKILLKRFGKAKEIAYAVLFLASRYADYITGQILHVDGGFKMA
jgi:3-oxoacyl-[acyl-carrier protein] reductase